MIVAKNCCNGIISSAIVIVALVLQMPIYIIILICKRIYILHFLFFTIVARCRCGGQAPFASETSLSNKHDGNSNSSTSTTALSVTQVQCLRCGTVFSPRLKSSQLEQLHPRALTFYKQLVVDIVDAHYYYYLSFTNNA
jgi:hypothetical protein